MEIAFSLWSLYEEALLRGGSMRLLFLIATVFQFSFAHTANAGDDFALAGRRFAVAKAPSELSNFVGGYSGNCVGENHTSGGADLVFGYFYTLNNGSQYYGVNFEPQIVHLGGPIEKPEFWSALDFAIQGYDAKSYNSGLFYIRPWKNTGAAFRDGSYVTTGNDDSYHSHHPDEEYETAFRADRKGLISQVSARFLGESNLKVVMYCSWYVKQFSCKDVPANYRGPVACRE